jgi:hypothetical protein
MAENPYEAPRCEFGHSQPWGLPEPGLASFVLALVASAVLTFAASHVRVDKTNRQPVVLWTGPAAAFIFHVAVGGWLLTFVAGLLASRALDRRGRQYIYGTLGLFLAIANVFGSCFFFGVIYED